MGKIESSNFYYLQKARFPTSCSKCGHTFPREWQPKKRIVAYEGMLHSLSQVRQKQFISISGFNFRSLSIIYQIIFVAIWMAWLNSLFLPAIENTIRNIILLSMVNLRFKLNCYETIDLGFRDRQWLHDYVAKKVPDHAMCILCLQQSAQESCEVFHGKCKTITNFVNYNRPDHRERCSTLKAQMKTSIPIPIRDRSFRTEALSLVQTEALLQFHFVLTLSILFVFHPLSLYSLVCVAGRLVVSFSEYYTLTIDRVLLPVQWSS